MSVHRTTAFFPVIGVLLLVAVSAAADGPPPPVKKGSVYVRAGLSVEEFRPATWDSLRLFVDDSATNNGDVTTTINGSSIDIGTLIHNDSDGSDYLPEVAFGFGVADSAFGGRFDGTVRIEFAARAYQRDESGSAAFLVSGDATQFRRIDGSTNPDGTDSTFLARAGLPITNLMFRQTHDLYSGNMMVLFDEDLGDWLISRGGGLTFSLHDQSFFQSFNFPVINLVDTGNTAGGDDSYSYDYDLRSYVIGMRFAFSVSRKLPLGLRLFWSGQITPAFGYAELDGRQVGPCYGSCDVDGTPPTFTRGVVETSSSKGTFVYDGRAAMGVGWQLWKLLISAQGGVNFGNAFFRPFENGNADRRVQPETASGWGYFAGVSATIVVP